MIKLQNDNVDNSDGISDGDHQYISDADNGKDKVEAISKVQ